MLLNTVPLRIFVVEDNHADFILLKECLAETLIPIARLDCAETFAKASERLRTEQYDLVFLDLSLPDTSGPETFGLLKPLLPVTPTIVLSGVTDLQLALQTLKDGAQDFLMKDNLVPAVLSKSVYFSIERMRHTLSLIEHAERLHFQSTVLGNITDAVIVTGLDKNVVYWNKAATETFGYAAEEMLGRPLDRIQVDLHDGTDPDSVARRLEKEDVFQTVVQRRTKKGHIIWVELKVTYNYDVHNNITGLIGVSKDITDLKAEEHLLTLFQSVILNANDAVVITEAIPSPGEASRKIVFVNRAFSEMTGFSPEEIIGQSLFRLTGPLTDSEAVDRLRQAMDRWEASEAELAYYRKDGSLFWVTVTVTPVSDHSGRFTHWVFIQRDITESKLAAEKLRAQNEELTKTNRELDRFVYSASHDLRAPLTSVLGLLSLMRKEPFADNAAIYLDKIQESVQRLDRLIQNIINYSRNSRLKPVLSQIDFRELFKSTVSMHQFMDNSRRIRFEYENTVTRPFYSDPERWQIILNNLVSNSIKFSRAHVDSFVTLKVMEQDGQLVIHFEDNGVGIAPDQISSVFEMFYRATQMSSGSGLGLYIVRQTVELLGGTIDVESRPEAFTRFTLTFPFPVYTPTAYAEKSS